MLNNPEKLTNAKVDSDLTQAKPSIVVFFNETIKKYLTPDNFIKKAIVLSISITILIAGIILCGFNGYIAFQLFFFQELDILSGYSLMTIFTALSFLLNFLVFFTLVEIYISFILKKKGNFYRLLISFPLCLFPMVIYLLINSVLYYFGSTNDSILRLFDRTLLILFQVMSLWLLANILKVTKTIKIEQGFIIALFSHLVGFSVVLFFTM